MTGREKSGEGKEELTFQSKLHHVSNRVEAALWHGHTWLPMEQAHCRLWWRWCDSSNSRWQQRRTRNATPGKELVMSMGPHSMFSWHIVQILLDLTVASFLSELNSFKLHQLSVYIHFPLQALILTKKSPNSWSNSLEVIKFLCHDSEEVLEIILIGSTLSSWRGRERKECALADLFWVKRACLSFSLALVESLWKVIWYSFFAPFLFLKCLGKQPSFTSTNTHSLKH